MLKENGYATGYVGKYHVDPHINEDNARNFNWRYIPKNVELTKDFEQSTRHNQQQACKLIQERGFDWVKHVYWGNMKAPL